MNLKKIARAIVAASFLTALPVLAANQDFSVTWSVVPNVTEYRLMTRVGTGTPVEKIVTTTTTTVTHDIAAGQTFYAKVRACTAIWCGDYSAEVPFVMPAKPGTPNILGIQLIVTGQ
jgi:hypothetical protein